MTAIRKRICLFSVQFNRWQCVIMGNEVEKHDRFERKHTKLLSIPVSHFRPKISQFYKTRFDRTHTN